jgi:DNA processing protein
MNPANNPKNYFYDIALTKLQGIGAVKSKKIYYYFESAENFFKASKKDWVSSKLVNKKDIVQLKSNKHFKATEDELKFIDKNKIQVHPFFSDTYPGRLNYFDDSPYLLYQKGNTDLNSYRIISIVGTRTPSTYGKNICAFICEQVSHFNPIILSGLALGIDSVAHQIALLNSCKTIGVLAHGLHKIYPFENKKMALQIIEKGGSLLSEYGMDTEPSPGNFPARNRIIAALCDVLLVVETKTKGGSVITCHFANEYAKDVYAVPGRINEPLSMGCNELIQQNKAQIFTTTEELCKNLKWAISDPPVSKSSSITLNKEETSVVNLLKSKESFHLNQIGIRTQMDLATLAKTLIELEIKGIIKALPGKYFKLH